MTLSARLISDADRGPAEVSRANNGLLSPDAYERVTAHPGAPLIAAVWRESESELRRCDAFDFDDLLACAVRLPS